MMRACQALVGVLGALALPSQNDRAAGQQVAPVSADVIVNLKPPGPVIDRPIYGQFVEHLGRGVYEGIWVGENSAIPNIGGYRRDVVEALRHAHVPVIRWHGGCFSEIYDWRDGIGARAKRPTRVTTNRPNTIDTNLTGAARGRLPTAPQIDSHNSFDAAETVKPGAFSDSVESGHVVITMPAKSIAVPRIE